MKRCLVVLLIATIWGSSLNFAIVKCKDAVVYVSVESDLSQENKISNQIKVLLENISEIKEVMVGVIPFGID